MGRLDRSWPGQSTPSWSPDARLVYFNSDATAIRCFSPTAPARTLVPISRAAQGTQPFFRKGLHTHNPVWSPDGEWIYFVHGTGPTGGMDVWRVRRRALAGAADAPARRVNFLAPLDPRTLLFMARAEDRSGPWLWALDVESKVDASGDRGPRAIHVGVGQPRRPPRGRDRGKPTASLWRVPMRDRRVEDGDAEPYPVPTERALAPRFGGTSLFFLSLVGPRDW